MSAHKSSKSSTSISPIRRQLTTPKLPISQKHPSLWPYYTYLTILSARLAHLQGNPRFAHNTLKRLLSNSLISTSSPHMPSDPPHILYTTHLALIHSHIIKALSSSNPGPNTPTKCTTIPALQRTLGAILDLHVLALSRAPASSSSLTQKDSHAQVALLSRYLFLHALVQYGEWARVDHGGQCAGGVTHQIRTHIAKFFQAPFAIITVGSTSNH